MKQNFTHKTRGTCSREIKITIDENIIDSVEFIGGCPGNLAGISRLIEGMDIDDVIRRVDGLQCGSRGTSCPDQLAKALIKMKLKTGQTISCFV
ncbi:MAG: TIGR03905 family TSCPD domain-containing protein [Spirochaetales bacterium]|nr:TIGR03905 family TSCPD domain-containing protein [Spirochaetales bacterium]